MLDLTRQIGATNLMSDDALPKWTEEDAEAVFTTLGKYWIIFQWVESLLDRLMLLAWGHENWAASQNRLARMSNAQKIEYVESMVLTTPDFARVHARPDWVSHFNSVIEALHSERKRRNSIMHSTVLFESAAKGFGPPILSTRTKSAAESDRFEQQWLSKEYQSKLLAEVAELGLKMNSVYVQLLHDSQATPRA
jgi:hypothetical protein